MTREIQQEPIKELCYFRSLYVLKVWMESSRFSKSCSFQPTNILSLQINGRLSHFPWNNKIINSLFTKKICSRKKATRSAVFRKKYQTSKHCLYSLGGKLKNTFWILDKKPPTESTLLKLKRSRQKSCHNYFLNSKSFEVFRIFFLSWLAWLN